MELYHNNGSTCSQKVRLVLREKGLKPEEHPMMLRDGDVHRPEYLRLNYRGVVPTLIDKGEVLIESSVICQYLDDAYPQNPLQPADPISKAKMRVWMLLPDAALHDACATLTVAVAFRDAIIASGKKLLENRPDYAGGNAKLNSALDNGLDSDRVPPSFQVYYDAIGRMAEQLQQTPWLAGSQYTLADVALLPYVVRLDDLGLSWFWDGDRAAVGDWYRRAQERPNFGGIADYKDANAVAFMQGKGKEATPRLRALIN